MNMSLCHAGPTQDCAGFVLLPTVKRRHTATKSVHYFSPLPPSARTLDLGNAADRVCGSWVCDLPSSSPRNRRYPGVTTRGRCIGYRARCVSRNPGCVSNSAKGGRGYVDRGVIL